MRVVVIIGDEKNYYKVLICMFALLAMFVLTWLLLLSLLLLFLKNITQFTDQTILSCCCYCCWCCLPRWQQRWRQKQRNQGNQMRTFDSRRRIPSQSPEVIEMVMINDMTTVKMTVVKTRTSPRQYDWCIWNNLNLIVKVISNASIILPLWCSWFNYCHLHCCHCGICRWQGVWLNNELWRAKPQE